MKIHNQASKLYNPVTNRRSKEDIPDRGGKRIRNFSLICATAFGLLSSGAYAQVPGSINLNAIPLQYTFTATNGGTYTEYVSPYPALISYGAETNVQAYITCLDVNNPTFLNQTYTGTWQTNTAAYTTELKQASWLSDQLYGLTQTTADVNTVGPIGLAIWSIMLPSSTIPSPPININAAAQDWINQASAAVANGYVADNIWFSPDNTTSQRFMLNPPSPVPEPSTYALFGIGAIGMLMVMRRKKKTA